MRILRCPQCGRGYQFDRGKVGYSILCATPGCQTMIPVKPPVSPWFIASVLGVGAALGIGYSYGHSTAAQPPAIAPIHVGQAPAASDTTPIRGKSFLYLNRGGKKRQAELIGTLAEPDAAIRQKRAQKTQTTASTHDREATRSQRRNHQTGNPTDLKAVFVPQPQAALVSLPTGTDVAPALAATGMGELTAINGTRQDAVVKLAAQLSSDGPMVAFRTVYVKAQQQYTVGRIGQGTYALFFALGDDWDQSVQAFRQNDTYSRFEKPLTFKETTSETSTSTGYRTGTQYSMFTVTLNQDLNGNARTNFTDKAAFDALN